MHQVYTSAHLHGTPIYKLPVGVFVGGSSDQQARCASAVGQLSNMIHMTTYVSLHM